MNQQIEIILLLQQYSMTITKGKKQETYLIKYPTSLIGNINMFVQVYYY